MHTALGSMDIVCKGDEIFRVAVVILQRYLRYRVSLGAAEIYYLVVHRIFMAVEIADKLTNTALIAHGVAFALLRALIGYIYLHAAVQKCLLAKSGVQYLIVIYRGVEKLGVGLKGDDRAVLIGIADHLHLLSYAAAGKLQLVYRAVLIYLDLKPLGQSVYDRCADAVQTAGDLIASATELAARVQHGIYDLERGSSGLRLNVYGYAAAVIGDGDGVAGVYGDGNMVTKTG